MAYVFKMRGSPFWWMGYLDEAKEQQQRSTKILVGTKPAQIRQSEKDAERMADDEERLCRDRREGRADVALVTGFTFDKLAAKYLTESAAKLESLASIKSRLKHLQAYFGPRVLTAILPGDIEAYTTHRLTTPAPPLHGKAVGKIPKASTVEHDRTLLRRMMNFALMHNLVRKNPVTKETEVPVDEVPVRFLEVEQVERLLRHAPERWRSFIAVALYCGLRKGEVIALRVKNVDLVKGIVTVRFSHGRTTTKGRKIRLVPISPELVPFLKAELGRVRSEYLFPNHKGGRLSKHTKTEKIIRRAAVAAGLVEGYDHLCRRKGCGYTERRADDAVAQCPTCGMRLWVRGNPIDIQFKDARSTWATHSYEATGDFHYVQKTLGHTDERITELYTAKRARHLSQQGAKLSYSSQNHLRMDGPVGDAGGQVLRIPLEIRRGGECAMGESNPRPLAPEPSGGVLQPFPPSGIPSQSLALSADPHQHLLAPDSTLSHPASQNPLRLTSAGVDRLLSLATVAARLEVPLSTARRLARSGRLPSLRLGDTNSIRVRESDLDAFIARGSERP